MMKNRTHIDVLQLYHNTEMMIEAIKVRRSNRTYAEVPLEEHHRLLIEKYLSTEELLEGPLRKTHRIEFLQKAPMNDDVKIGTYGYLKGPQAFLVGISENEKLTLFDIAYVFQGLVLLVTSQGIRTCWLGGIFNQDSVRASTYVADEEIVPAISPVGYHKDTKHLVGWLAPKLLKPHKRKPVEDISFYMDFNTPFIQQNDILQEAIYLGTLAPSAQNKQSWRIVVSEDYQMVHLYVKFKLKKQVHGNFRGYACPPEYLDIGIFYKHFELAMKSNGISGELIVSDPRLKLPDNKHEYIISWKMNQ